MDTNESIKQQCIRAKRRAMAAGCMPVRVRDEAIRRMGDRLVSESAAILEINSRDVERARGQLPESAIERLRLDEGRISALRERLEQLAARPDPLWQGSSISLAGDSMTEISAPYGAVAFSCRGDPERTVMAAALCAKTGNAAVILSDAYGSATDRAITDCLGAALGGGECGPYCLENVQSATLSDAVRGECGIDMLVWCGRHEELQRLKAGALIPIMSGSAGTSHIYIDGDCDIGAAVSLTLKSVYPRDTQTGTSVVLLVHNRIAAGYLAALEQAAQPYRPEYRACPVSREYLSEAVPAVRDDWMSETLCEENIIAIRAVATLDEAIEHTNTYGTAPVQAIVSGRLGTIRRFCREVDAPQVRVNSPLPRRASLGEDMLVRRKRVYIGI